MHAKRRHGGRSFCAIDVINEDHRVAFVCRAFATGSDASAAANAALWIDEHRFFHRLAFLYFTK